MGKSIKNVSSVTRIGLDLAKNVFQVHGIDAKREVVVARKLRHGALVELFAKLAPCIVAMEACASAHHWARRFVALGHEDMILEIMSRPPLQRAPAGLD